MAGEEGDGTCDVAGKRERERLQESTDFVTQVTETVLF